MTFSLDEFQGSSLLTSFFIQRIRIEGNKEEASWEGELGDETEIKMRMKEKADEYVGEMLR